MKKTATLEAAPLLKNQLFLQLLMAKKTLFWQSLF